MTIDLKSLWKNISYLLPFLIGTCILPFAVIDLFPHPFQNTKFYVLYLSGTLGIALLALTDMKSYLVRLEPHTLYLLYVLLSVLAFNYWLHDVSPFFVETFQRIIFWSLVLFFVALLMTIPATQIRYIFIPAFISLFIFVIIDLTIFLIFAEHRPYFTFGNENMSAEYACLLLGIALGMYETSQNNRKLKQFLDTLIPLTITYIIYCNSRSTYIALALCCCYLVFSKSIRINSLIKLTLVTAILSSLYFIIFIQYHDFSQLGTAIGKQHSSQVRWDLIIYSLQIVFQHPFGIGLGGYEFGALPYLSPLFPYSNEHVLFKSPHMELLRFVIEDGILAVGLMGLLILSFLLDVRSKIPKTIKYHPEIVGYFLVLGVQFGTQFPLDNPFPLFMTAFMVSYFLVCLEPNFTEVKLRTQKIVFIPLFLILLMGTGLKIFSEYIDKNYQTNLKLNKISCTVDPSNWSACLNPVASNLNMGHLKEAEQGARQELARRPNNHHAIKYLAFSYLDQGQVDLACFYIKKYDSFFQEQSSLHRIYLEKCTIREK